MCESLSGSSHHLREALCSLRLIDGYLLSLSNCDFVKVTPPVSGFQTSSSNPKFGVGLWKGLEDTVRASIRIIFLGQLGGKIIGGGWHRNALCGSWVAGNLSCPAGGAQVKGGKKQALGPRCGGDYPPPPLPILHSRRGAEADEASGCI